LGRRAKDADNYVNFTPPGIEVSFASDSIWYPLELSQFIDEPASYLVLDILTPERWDLKQLPEGLTGKNAGRMDYRGQAYEVTRVTGKLVAKQKSPDLKVRVTVKRD
jgi:hypothetical protein